MASGVCDFLPSDHWRGSSEHIGLIETVGLSTLGAPGEYLLLDGHVRMEILSR